MITLLSKIFIKNPDDNEDPKVRSAWGLLCSVLSIVLNVIVFAAKYVIGLLSGSVSITADSFNNLSDAGSSVLVLLGFKFAGMKPTPERPFGHGRIEYVTGLIVSFMILIVGYTTLLEAIEAIRNPADPEFSIAALIVLVLSVLVKFYMAFYSRKVGDRIGSSALRANSMDNLTDTISTGLTLIALLLNHFYGWRLDGYVALLVAVLLLKAGIECGWDTLKDLLGKKADPALTAKVEEIAMSYDEIVGIHDLVIHDYGPARLYISLHCEVPGSGDIFRLHDAMDRCMAELDEKLHCESVIHMDPVDTENEELQKMKEEIVAKFRAEIHAEISVHDFRCVPGPTHNNVIFDAQVPLKTGKTDEEIEAEMKKIVRDLYHHTTFAIIKIDHPYV